MRVGTCDRVPLTPALSHCGGRGRLLVVRDGRRGVGDRCGFTVASRACGTASCDRVRALTPALSHCGGRGRWLVVRDGDVGTVRLRHGVPGMWDCVVRPCARPHPGPLPLRREREVGW